ncbi:MAG: hypothetical protein N4A65_06515 [Cohaesibacter sp.]|jgi:serine O-acetyltransferase|nr:hypothetical protein [Cohaesibacter sp.]
MQIEGLNILGGYAYVERQVVRHLNLLHDLDDNELNQVQSHLSKTLEAVQRCWSEISNKYYNRDGQATFDINNSNQYGQLLLIFARQLHCSEQYLLADKVFGLNKMLNSCDIYHAVELPKSFYIDHTLGIVVGRAKFGNRLFLSQNCTIGSNPGNSNYPELGQDNYLMSNSTLVGAVKTGDRVIFGAGSFVKDMEVPSDSIVFGRFPDNIIKPLKSEAFKTATPFIVG